MKTPSKQLGNLFENKMSKLLSTWIFKDKLVLQRHLTSGAIKSTYVGDIVPLKQINWNKFPFLIECKSGYKSYTPTLYSFSKITDWLSKALSEVSEKQNIIWLIAKFKSQRGIIFITNHKLNNITPQLIIPLNEQYFYQYNLEELVNFDFYELFDDIDFGNTWNHY